MENYTDRSHTPNTPKGRCLRLLAALLFAVLGLSVPAAAQTAAPPLDSVILQLKWKHQFQFAGYYAAIEQGYYREVGMSVELREAETGMDYVGAVLDGVAHFGVAASELALLRGRGKPVVALAPIYQHSPLVLLALASSKIDSIHELSGKRVMLDPHETEVYAYLKAEDVPIDSITIVKHTYDTTMLIDGSVDVMSAYSTDETYRLQESELDYVVFNPRAGGIDFYGDTLFTSETQVKNHPDRVRKFLEASLRGWEYALANPEKIAELIYNKYSNRHTIEHLLFEARETRRLIQPDLVELGYVNPGRWDSIAQTYTQLGLMPKGASIDGLIYDRNPPNSLRLALTALGGSILITAAVTLLALYLYWLNGTIRRQADDLKRAMEDIKTLRGTIPICSYCKKIRNDQGAWTVLEQYISEHSEAEFSHGMCTDCYDRVRAEMHQEKMNAGATHPRHDNAQ